MGRARMLDPEQPRARLLPDEPPIGEQYGPPDPSVPEQYGPPAELNTPPNVPLDVAKGIGSGVERGVVGMPGIPTDLARLAQFGWLELQDKLYGEKGWITQDPLHRRRLEAQIAQGGSFLLGSRELIEAAKPYVPGIDYEPQTKAGELGQTFGEMLPGAVVPGQLMMRGAGGAAKVGRGVVDALYQAAAPAVAAETAESLAKDTPFAPYAAPAAAIATSLATQRLPVPRGAAAVPGVSRGAVERANRAITDEGGHAAVAGELDRLGEAGTLMDAGPNLRGQAEALVSSPGPAQTDLLRAVRERNEAAADRITAGVNRALGDPVNYERDTQALLDQRRLRGNRFYGQAEQSGGRIDTTPVVQHIESLLPTNIAANASTPTPIERALLDARGRLQNRSDMRSLHNVKEGLDDQIAAAVRAKEGAMANRLAGVRDRLVQQLEEGTTLRDPQGQPLRGPDGRPQSLYRQAREEYAGDSAVLRAREEGLTAFDRNLTPNQMAIDNRARTEAERIAFQMGARQAIELKMGNSRNDAKAVRDTFEVPFNRAKLIQVVGQEEANNLIRLLRQETRIAGTNQRLTSASATAGRQAAQKEFPSSLPGAERQHWPSITEWPTRILQGAYNRTVAPVINTLNRESRGEISRDAGRILSMPAGDERARLLEQLRQAYEGGDRRVPASVTAPMAGYGAELDSDRPPLELTVHPSRRR